MNHQTLCELNGYLFCLLLPWCTASTICDIAHTSHLSLQIPPPEKKQQLWALLSLLCATWWCSLKSMNEDISGAVYAEQSHLGLTLPPSLRPQHPPPPPLFPPPPLPGWLVFLGFFFSLTSQWGIALPQHITSIAYCCCSSSSAGFFQPPLPIITCSR